MDSLHPDEIDVILAYLEAADGDIEKTAKATGISPRKLKELVAQWEQKARATPDPQDPPADAGDDLPDDEGLTYKQRLFVDAYLGRANGNATEAARLAGYKGSEVTLASVGYENLRKPQIAARIEARLTASAMSASEVLARLSEQARASLDDFGQGLGDRLLLDLGKAQRRGKLRLLKKLSYNQNGDPAIELYSAQAALKLLAQYHGLLSASRDDELDGLLDRLLAEAAAKRQAADEAATRGGPGAEPTPPGD